MSDAPAVASGAPTGSPTTRPTSDGRSLPGIGLAATAAGVAIGSAAAGMARLRRRRPSTETVPQGVATTDGLRLHTTVHGDRSAPAAVVFVHGWTMSGEFWTGHAEALARRGLLTVTYDQRGHGRSGRPGRDGFDLQHLGNDLAAVLDATVPTRTPVVLVGHSMGGMTVMAWAGRTQPSRHDVRATVLANTAVHELVSDAVAALTGTTNRLVHQLLRQAAKVPTPVPSTPINRRLVRTLALSPDAPDSAVELTHRLFLACPPSVRVGFAHQIDVLDLREGASRLHVPTLVLTATNDRLTPPSHAQRLVELLPDARLQVVPGSGHQLPLERPADTIHLVHDHVRRHALVPDPRHRDASPPRDAVEA